jgi:hypothetical protein
LKERASRAIIDVIEPDLFGQQREMIEETMP